MVPEINVSVKDEEKTLKKKFLIYEPFSVNVQDPIINKCIEETLKNFSSEPLKVTVKITLQME